jgi:hypothetical protein
VALKNGLGYAPMALVSFPLGKRPEFAIDLFASTSHHSLPVQKTQDVAFLSFGLAEHQKAISTMFMTALRVSAHPDIIRAAFV